VTPERWKRLREAFEGALERPQHARKVYLAEAFRDDETLRRDVEVPLAADELSDAFLEAPGFPQEGGVSLPEGSPTAEAGRRATRAGADTPADRAGSTEGTFPGATSST
jgi:hypothetical protein